MKTVPTSPSTLPVVLLIGVSFLFLSELNAQTTASGAVAGVVTDQSSAVITHAEVQITNDAKGTTQSTRTDGEGVYRFFFVTPGAYTLSVRHTGFRDVKRTVNVFLGPAVSANITLEIGEAKSEITVSDEAPLIHAENGDASATVTQQPWERSHVHCADYSRRHNEYRWP